MSTDEPQWLETPVLSGLRLWQIVFLALAGFMAVVIALCCCLRFRVPRTKQQIEANYHRRIITKKFRQQLEKIQNSDMDSVDLKKALEIIRANLKIDQDGDKDHQDHQQSASLISSIVSPVQSLDEASFKSSHTLNNKQQAEPQCGTKTKPKFGNKFSTLIRTLTQKPCEKIDTNVSHLNV